MTKTEKAVLMRLIDVVEAQGDAALTSSGKRWAAAAEQEARAVLKGCRDCGEYTGCSDCRLANGEDPDRVSGAVK